MRLAVARKEAEDLVLERILGEMAEEMSSCRSSGMQCDKIKEFRYRQYCRRCKAEYLLGVIFAEKKESSARC